MKWIIIKIFLVGIIIITWYAVSIFLAPEIASSIDRIIGVPGLSESIRGWKNTLDWAITDIPNLEEFKSGALDIKTKISEGIGTTKETIDQIRSGAQKVQDGYVEAKNTYDSVKESLSWAVQSVNDIKNAADSFSESFSGSAEN